MTKYFRLLLMFPLRPKIYYKEELIKPTYKELYLMLKRSDYVVRVIDQVNECPVNFSKNQLLTLLYSYIKEQMRYLDLCEKIQTTLYTNFIEKEKKNANSR